MMNFPWDIGYRQHVDQRDAKEPRIGPHPNRHVWNIQKGGHRGGGITDDKKDDAVVDPPAHLVMQRVLRLEQRINGSVHHE